MDESEVGSSLTSPVVSALESFISSVDALAEAFPLNNRALIDSIGKIIFKSNDNYLHLLGEFAEAQVTDTANKFRALLIEARRNYPKPNLPKPNLGLLSEMTEIMFSDMSWMKDYSRRFPRIVNLLDKDAKSAGKLFLAHKLIQQSFVNSLISQFDIFLSKLMRALFLIRPEVLNSSEKNISFSQLQNFHTLDDAKEFIVEKEIENIMRKSHADQIDWLEKQYNIKLIQELSSWPKFIEVTERRNLFVHTGGMISGQYIAVCRKYGVVFTEDIELGQDLDVSPIYFRQAHECILETGIKIAHLLWRKIQPKALEDADSSLNSICYQFLSEGRYDLVSNILDFSVENLKKHSNDANKRMFIVNRAQAYKWRGDDKKAKSIMAEIDWSASSDMFRLAEAVIMDDLDKANSLVRKMGANGDAQMSSYREWPLFKEYRKNEEFLKIFEEIFEESFYSYKEEDLFKNIEWLHNIDIQEITDEDVSEEALETLGEDAF